MESNQALMLSTVLATLSTIPGCSAEKPQTEIQEDCGEIQNNANEAIKRLLEDGEFFSCDKDGNLVPPKNIADLVSLFSEIGSSSTTSNTCQEVIKKAEEEFLYVIQNISCHRLPDDSKWRLYEKSRYSRTPRPR
jgi:hypothetical protein